jgi:exosortase
MAGIATPPVLRARLEAAAPAVPWRVAAVALVLAVAHLPLLGEHASNLWSRPHYQFFPFVLAGTAALAFQRGRRLGTLRPGSRRACYVWLAFSAGLLTFAAAVNSPWLGAVAALLTLAAVLFAVGGAGLLRRLLPAWALLWLAVPPPFLLDQQLISALQTLTARLSSRVLDVFGVLHVLAGHVVEVPGRRLLVEEACSGIHSFFAVLPVTLFFVLWVRRPLVRATLLLLAAAGWMLVANVARVVGITVLVTRWGVDVTTGWPHEAFGLGVFAATLGLLWSSDRLILVLTAWNPLRRRPAARPGPPGGTPAAAAAGGGPTRLPDFQATGLAAWPVTAAYGALACANLWLLWLVLSAPAPALDFDTLGADALPARRGPWQRTGYETEVRDRHDQLGRFSQRWLYRAGPHNATVALDYPFPGWHELTICYRSQGWTVEERLVHVDEAAAQAGGPFVEVKLRKPPGRYAYLLFSGLDAAGRPLRPRDEGLRAQVGARLFFLPQLHPSLRADTYQVQVLVPSYAPLTPAEQRQAQDLFQHARGLLRPPGRGTPEVSR